MTKREKEKAIFEAFIEVCPTFAGESIKHWRQPTDESEFPDVICISTSNKRIGVELVEWLHQEQTRDTKDMGRVQESILKAIGEQGVNKTDNIDSIWMKAN